MEVYKVSNFDHWQDSCIKIHYNFEYFVEVLKWYVEVINRVNMNINAHFTYGTKETKMCYDTFMSKIKFNTLSKEKFRVFNKRSYIDNILIPYSFVKGWRDTIRIDYYNSIGLHNLSYKIEDCYFIYKINKTGFKMLSDEDKSKIKNDSFINVWLELFTDDEDNNNQKKFNSENMFSIIKKFTTDCIGLFLEINNIIEEYNLDSDYLVNSINKYLEKRDVVVKSITNEKSLGTIIEKDMYKEIPYPDDDLLNFLDFLDYYLPKSRKKLANSLLKGCLK